MPGVRCSASERVAASIQPKSGSHVASFTKSGHDDDDGVGAGDRVGVVGGRAQPAGRHQLGELLLQVGLARERLDAGVDEVDDRLVHVDADDLVALSRRTAQRGGGRSFRGPRRRYAWAQVYDAAEGPAVSASGRAPAPTPRRIAPAPHGAGRPRVAAAGAPLRSRSALARVRVRSRARAGRGRR